MNRKAIVCFMVFALGFAQGATAGVRGFLEDLYMYTATTPQVFETQSRGVAVGGHLAMRTPIRSVNIVSLQAPRLDFLGCGGIDFYGGAFSMINKNEAIQILRQIGAQALMYAFKLALETISGMIAKTIGDLFEQIISFINQFRNTCQMAQTIVDTTVGDGLRTWSRNVSESYARQSGTASCEDAAGCAEASQSEPDKHASDQAEAGEPPPAVGNLTWMGLGGMDVSWSRLFEEDVINERKAKEIMMSLVGTHIYCPALEMGPQANPNVDPTLTLREFFQQQVIIVGDDEDTESVGMTVMVCEDPGHTDTTRQCCEVREENISIGGFRELAFARLKELDLILETGQAATLQNEEWFRFLNSTSAPALAMMNRYRFQPAARDLLIGIMADIIAKEMLIRFGDEVVRISSQIYRNREYAKPEHIERTHERLIAEHRHFAGNFATQAVNDLIDLHNLAEHIDRYIMQQRSDATTRQARGD